MYTYNTLTQMVQKWLLRSNNDQLTNDSIPEFIALAQDRISSDYENVGFEKTVSSTPQDGGGFLTGVSVYQKPIRWRRTLYINFGSGIGGNQRNNLLFRDYSFLTSYWPDRAQTGIPLYYADYDYTAWLIGPTPNANYPFEVRYIEMPEPLSDQNQTNWLTVYAYGLLFYASLIEAMPFLQNDERTPTLQRIYEQRLISLKEQDKKRIQDATTGVGKT